MEDMNLLASLMLWYVLICALCSVYCIILSFINLWAYLIPRLWSSNFRRNCSICQVLAYKVSLRYLAQNQYLQSCFKVWGLERILPTQLQGTRNWNHLIFHAIIWKPPRVSWQLHSILYWLVVQRSSGLQAHAGINWLLLRFVIWGK